MRRAYDIVHLSGHGIVTDKGPRLIMEVQGGLPCVVGWTRPVGDGTATLAAAELYQRLCSGEVPTQAVARTRQRLHEEALAQPLPRHACTG